MATISPIKHVVIAGCGFTPYLTGHFILQKWGGLAPRVTIIHCGENPDPPVLNCVSSLKAFHGDIKIPERDFVGKTTASFHLGTTYRQKNQHDFFMCEAPYGSSLNGVRFHHWFQQYQAAGQTGAFDDFCINAQLAKLRRFVPRSDKPNSAYAQVHYGYKLLSENYADYLRSRLDSRTTTIKAKIENISLKNSGYIDNVYLSNGQRITADLFIDCSQEHHLKRALNAPKSATLNDIWQVHETLECGIGAPSNSLLLANNALTLETELHGKTYRQIISCNADAAPDWLIDSQPWQKNCIALGPAVSCRPGLLIDSVHLVASALYRLYSLWPASEDFQIPAISYNSATIDEWSRIADSDSLHTWAACGKNENCLTASAKHRLDVFISDGRNPLYENETMTDDQWAALFLALGIQPKVADPLTAEIDAAPLVAQLEKLRETLRAAAQHAPELEKFYRENVVL